MIALMIDFDLCGYISTYVIRNKNPCDMKIYFHSVKINVYSVRNIYLIYIFFHSSNIYFHYINFSLNTFLASISGLAFAFTKVRMLYSMCKLGNSTRM